MKIKNIREEAKGILYSNGNSLRLVLLSILSMFAVLVPVLVYVYTSSLIITLFDENGENILISYILPALPAIAAAVFISMPAISGAYHFGACVCDGDKTDYLSGYTNGYFKSMATGGILTLRWIPAIIVLVLTAIVPPLAAEAADEALQPFYEELYSQYDMLIDIEWLISTLINWGVTVALMAIAAMLSIITVLLSGSIFFFPFFIARGLSVSEALNRSRELTMQHKGIGPRFLLSFLPLLLLSALTLGLLFVFYVLPLMLLTYFSLAEKICDETM